MMAMSAGRLITIPFAVGQDESDCPRELPMGAFREVVNIRQRRGKQFGMRADYLAASMTEFDGTLVPYDLFGLSGRLFALGDRQGVGSTTDVFEYVEQPGGAWKGTLPVGADAVRVPPFAALRNVGQTPDAGSEIQTARVAAVNGIVCVAYGFGETTGGADSYVHIFRAATDSTILLEAIDLTNPHVVVAGDSFWIVGVNSSSDLEGLRFDTTVDDNLRNGITLYTGTVTSCICDAYSVDDAPISEFVTLVRDGSTTVVSRFNEAGTEQSSFAGPAVAADVLAIEANAAQDQIVVVTRVGAADANVSTYDLTSEALLAGPTAVFGQTVEGRITISRNTLSLGNVEVNSDDATATVRSSRFTASNHAGAGAVDRSYHGYRIGGKASRNAVTTMHIYPMVSADSSNHVVAVDLRKASGQVQFVAAATDFAIAHPLAHGESGGGQICVDATTGLYYWTRLLEGTDGEQIFSVSEFRHAGTERRQTCQVGNEAFVAGSVPLSFDTRQLVEQGFVDRPVFVSSTPSNGAGALTPLGVYKVVAVFKWTNAQNALAQSRVSAIQTVTMGASDDTITHVIYAPHTMRKDSNSDSAVTVSLYRTEAGGAIFQLAATTKVPIADEFGEPITIVDTMADTDLLDEEPVYTQGEDGPLSGVLQNDPAPPCRYCWTVGQRVFIGGLPDESEVAISKELAPGEALSFSDAFAFRARVAGVVTAVAGLDGAPIAFTAERIYRFPGLLPSDNGTEGQLGPALVIPSEGGCSDARSILETSHGLFYKARDGKMMLLPRGDGAPVWIGERIRDALEAFPVITATAYADEDHCALFACQAADGLSSIILVFDLRIGQWYRDTFASAQVIRAATGYRGRLAYIDSATVRLQSSSLTPSAFIPYNAKTGSIVPFDRWGSFISVTTEGEFRGNAQVRCRVSYDDGVTFTNMETQTFTTAGGFVQGQSITIQWWPRIRKCASFVLDFQVLTNGTATEGILLNTYTLEVIGPRVGRVRTAQSERG